MMKRWICLCLTAVLALGLCPLTLAEETAEEPAPAVAEVGAVITFGRYEQDADTSDGSEPIEWRVLAVEDGKALLVSDKALTARPFNDTYAPFSWVDSSLRAWLNGEFMSGAFTPKEAAAIVAASVDNSAAQGCEDYPPPSEAAAAPTTDRVFILSYGEIQRYFSGRSAKRFQCELTAQAVADGAFVGSANSYGWWWLRSPGAKPNDAAGMRNTGRVNHRDVSSVSGAVRPAMWIDIAAAGFAQP